MLSRFSVKHPYLIVVTVIICLILGGVSLAKMKTDLMPDMDVPYLAVIATDPGASAEKVETEVTDVLESALSTVNGVASISSQSANNYAMVFLEFEDGTDMDSAMVKVSSAVNQVESTLPEAVGTPNIMEISLDMMATMYVAAADGEKSIYELSDFAADTLVPRLERVDGVADVSLAGAVQQTAEVRLSDDKIEDVNNRILASVNGELADAKREIDDGRGRPGGGRGRDHRPAGGPRRQGAGDERPVGPSRFGIDVGRLLGYHESVLSRRPAANAGSRRRIATRRAGRQAGQGRGAAEEHRGA